MKETSKLKSSLFLSLASILFTYHTATAQCVAASVGCSDRTNVFLTSSDPNTIEYDNIVSTFHATMASQMAAYGFGGERMHHDGVNHILSPRLLNATNYPGLTGEILKFAGGSYEMLGGQYAVLTTAGLYMWGSIGNAPIGTARGLVSPLLKALLHLHL